MPEIQGLPSTTAAFLGETERGPQEPRAIDSYSDFIREYGSAGAPPTSAPLFLAVAVHGFFANGGSRCYIVRVAPGHRYDDALLALEQVPDVSLVCAPDQYRIPGLDALVVRHCEKMRHRFAILDSATANRPAIDSTHAATYFPWIGVDIPDAGVNMFVPPCGHMAGLYARVETTRGIWRSPSSEPLVEAQRLQVQTTAAERDRLNALGVNCLVEFPGRGIRTWSARTLSNDPEWKYIAVRRYVQFLERSIEEGTRWTVSEPNGDALWIRVRRDVEEFLLSLFRQGALAGSRPDDAFFVRVDRTTMTQDDIDAGRLVGVVGVAPVRPAEFVILRFAVKKPDGE